MTKANHARTTSRAPDPIFAAIAAHKAAEQAYGDAIRLTERLESELPEEMRQSDLHGRDGHIVETDDPRWIAAERAFRAASEEEEECGAALLDVRPTTFSGLQNLLRYADECDRGREWPDRVVSAAAEALETLAPIKHAAETDPDLSRFGKAYLEWVEARAELAKINVRGYVKVDVPDPDGVCNRIIDRIGNTERQLAFHPVGDYRELIEKFEALVAMIYDRERDGYPNDSRHLLMLSSFRADLNRARFQMEGDGE